jgi:hypothetical protein
VASPKFKEAVYWTSVVLFYGSGMLLAYAIYGRAGMVPVVAAGAWWFVTLCGMHAMHEMHASAPLVGQVEERFKKPDVPQR